MGNAIIQFNRSKYFDNCQNVILVWGDIPFIDQKTISLTIKSHLKNNNDFTFPTYVSQNPYTKVIRNKNGQVIEVIESREYDYEKKLNMKEKLVFLYLKKKLFLIY